MRRLALLCCATMLVACEKPKEQPAADTTTAAVPPPAPVPIALADVAGKWTVRTMPMDADTVLVTYELVAGSDSSGWVINFPKRKPVPMHVSASGDSLITEAGPFESVLRKGVKVKTNSVFRLKDGKLVGTTVAHYNTKGADSVRSLRMEGTKNQ